MAFFYTFRNIMKLVYSRNRSKHSLAQKCDKDLIYSHQVMGFHLSFCFNRPFFSNSANDSYRIENR
ncbi:hypothetical protein VCRA2119O147_180059 [Vibrio crassostreae]|nr:hypothetical protein VCRA2118O239_100059 [Vibrio crassostreae]CAK1697650.1 hypothetical protein VCRA2113O196_100059 [Vibrio crassostreae]CAK1697728.1 hypothetical protein VCRA2110O113_100058 [Vibrio crassostreae]CAK1697968.1 hypothetical protein VCRA2112O185_100059 [Vibrio crassostreae]CAK1698055.1 hypothetical protein VCRA2117O376_100060 [Vibrio crassostreae]